MSSLFPHCHLQVLQLLRLCAAVRRAHSVLRHVGGGRDGMGARLYVRERPDVLCDAVTASSQAAMGVVE